jgi:hypothetical protein
MESFYASLALDQFFEQLVPGQDASKAIIGRIVQDLQLSMNFDDIQNAQGMCAPLVRISSRLAILLTWIFAC